MKDTCRRMGADLTPEILESFSERRLGLLEQILCPLIARGGPREVLIETASDKLQIRLSSMVIAAKNEVIATDKAQSAAKDEVITAKEEVIAAKEEVIAAKEEEIREVIANRSLRWLLNRRFQFVDHTISLPNISDAHDPATTEERKVNLEQIRLPDKFWDATFAPPLQEEKGVHSEAMVVVEVTNILQAILIGLGIADRVRIANNRMVAGLELDIVLLLGSQYLPFAAIEVKKPGPEGHDDIFFSSQSNHKDAGKVQGQNLDQLNVLKLTGLRSVYGIISSGNKWMVTGTQDWSLENENDWNLCDLREKMSE
jgi:hypothetical protein